METYLLDASDSSDIDDLIVSRLIKKPREHHELPDVPSFCLDNFTHEQTLNYFRFTKSQILVLAAKLLIPAVVIAPNRSRVEGVEAFCILLRRFAYPCRWVDVQLLFKRQISELTYFFTLILDHIYDN